MNWYFLQRRRRSIPWKAVNGKDKVNEVKRFKSKK